MNAGFAERLLEVIDSGRRTATYKPALLLALLGLCARHSDAHGQAPQVLYTRDIAEHVASLYWPQVIPYLVPGATGATMLRQITLPRAAIVAAVSSFRSAAEEAGVTSWHLARLRLPGPYEAMLDQVEVTVAEQPLPGCRPSDPPTPCSRSCTGSAGYRGNRSPRPGCVATGPVAPPSSCCPARVMSSCGSAR